MALLCFLVGLGLAHHRTIVLLLPGLALYLVWQAPRLLRPQRAWLLWLLALAAPLLLYSYIPLRAAAGVRDLHGSYLPTWSGFWDHVLARGYTGFFTDNPLSVSRSAADWLQLWVGQLGWWGALLFLAGLGHLLRRRAPWFAAWVMLGVVLATNFGFALLYRVGDQQVFMIPAFLCAAIFVGGGVNLLRQPLRRPGWSAAAGLAAVLLLLVDPGRGAPVDRSHDWAAHDYAVDMAKVNFAPGSRVIGLEGEMTALRYHAGGRRPRVQGDAGGGRRPRRTPVGRGRCRGGGSPGLPHSRTGRHCRPIQLHGGGAAGAGLAARAEYSGRSHSAFRPGGARWRPAPRGVRSGAAWTGPADRWRG